MGRLPEIESPKASSADALRGAIACLIAVPEAREIMRDMVRGLLAEELAQGEVMEQLQGVVRSEAKEIAKQALWSKSPIRKQVSTKKAADILGYHPKYLCRHAGKWGLTKVYMSNRSCRFYLDEIEALMEERGWLPDKSPACVA